VGFHLKPHVHQCRLLQVAGAEQLWLVLTENVPRDRARF
jgi:hypothetical protein